MTSDINLPISGDGGSQGFVTMQHTQLASLQYFPHAVFLFNKDMELIESNRQAEFAIENQWVGVRQGKLHFNTIENNRYVKHIIQRLNAPMGGVRQQEERSQRFIIRNIDMVCRPYIITKVSPDCDRLLLSIQDDINCSDSKMDCLARAFSLTLSETRIVKMMVAGLKPKEIAFEANISLNTVRSHLRTLYAKMQVSSYNDALTYAIKLLV